LNTPALSACACMQPDATLSPSDRLERERERGGERERGREGDREKERDVEYSSFIFIFKRNDGCLGTVWLSSDSLDIYGLPDLRNSMSDSLSAALLMNISLPVNLEGSLATFFGLVSASNFVFQACTRSDMTFILFASQLTHCVSSKHPHLEVQSEPVVQWEQGSLSDGED
jgi:hypothetical protein